MHLEFLHSNTQKKISSIFLHFKENLLLLLRCYHTFYEQRFFVKTHYLFCNHSYFSCLCTVLICSLYFAMLYREKFPLFHVNMLLEVSYFARCRMMQRFFIIKKIKLFFYLDRNYVMSVLLRKVELFIFTEYNFLQKQHNSHSDKSM